MQRRRRPLFSERLPLTALWAAVVAGMAAILVLAGWGIMWRIAAPLAVVLGIVLTVRRLRTRVRQPDQAGGSPAHAQSRAVPSALTVER